MPDLPVTLVDPAAVHGGGEIGPFPFDMFARKALAQGDSWFSIGAFPPGATSNIVNELVLSRSTAVVNCARPGRLLAHMTDRVADRQFLRLLTGNLALRWDVILLSGGGNDVIDAAGAGPQAAPERRLLLRPDERGTPNDAAGFLSAAGWATFERHLSEVFAFLMRKRAAGINRETPVVLHNYAPIMPRPAPAGFGNGPWLEPTMRAFGVPQANWGAIAAELLARLDALLRRLAAQQPHVQVVDTLSAGLAMAVPDAVGLSGDWHNEIHPTTAGYRKLARSWRAVLDTLP